MGYLVNKHLLRVSSTPGTLLGIGYTKKDKRYSLSRSSQSLMRETTCDNYIQASYIKDKLEIINIEVAIKLRLIRGVREATVLSINSMTYQNKR